MHIALVLHLVERRGPEVHQVDIRGVDIGLQVGQRADGGVANDPSPAAIGIGRRTSRGGGDHAIMDLAPRHDDVLGCEFGILNREIVDRALHGIGHTPLPEAGPDFDFGLRASRHALQQYGGAATQPGDLRQAHASRAAAQHLQNIAAADLLFVSFFHVALLIIVVLKTCLNVLIFPNAPPPAPIVLSDCRKFTRHANNSVKPINLLAECTQILCVCQIDAAICLSVERQLFHYSA